jgi:putative spermidine/putrescine transport system permease protein
VVVTLFTVLPMLLSVTAGLTNNYSARFGQRLHHALARRGVVQLYGATAWRSLALALACVRGGTC